MTFNVQAEMTVLVSKNVTAKTLEEAVEKAKELRTADFITVDGDWIDESAFRITGVYE